LSASADALRESDAHARARAQREFERPLVIEAGAGTGKTATLVARVLAWSLGPGWERAVRDLRQPARDDAARVAAQVLDRVVAITFTDAAAAEMARRVDDALARLASGECPIGVDPEALPAAALLARRAAALRSALDHLQVQTIHAWCRRLLAAHPLAAGVHPGFELDASGRVAADALRAALERQLRAAYAARDARALALAERGIGPAELEQALLGLRERGIRADELARDPATLDRLEALLSRLREALEGLRDAGGRALARADRDNAAKVAEAVTTAIASLPERATRESIAACAEALRGLFEKLVGHVGKWRKGEFSGRELVAFGSGADAVAAAAARLEPLLVHVLAIDLPLLDAVREVLGGALADAEQSLRRSGTLGFSELLSGAASLLAERPDVAASVRSQIDQLLVDEFQDTDRRQCAIVASLALAGPPASRPGLFLVGDPKQSIYGWREADLAAYEGFVRRALEEGGELHRLSVNHRSVQSILREVERVVGPVMQAQPGLQPGFEPLVPRPGAEEGEPVEYWLPATRDPDTGALAQTSAALANACEAQALANHLRALHEGRGVAWGEMAVLMRSRGDWEIYLEALRRHGIPFRVEGDRSYYRRREIIEAAAFVRCVLDPDDALALVAALRSSAVGVPDAAWQGLFAIGLPARAARLEGRSADGLAELARDVLAVAAALPAGVPGIERVQGWERNLVAALSAVARLRRLYQEAPPDVFVEALRDALCFEASEAARFLGSWRVANLERFFRGLAAQLADGAGTAQILRELRRAVAEEEPSEEMQPRDLESDGVRVSTLHGAKGLDFGCVFLVQLHKAASRQAPEVEVGRVADQLEYRVLGARTPGFDAVRTTRESVEAAERVRLLYVGMTRARDRLVLSGLWSSFGRTSDNAVALLERRAPAPPDWADAAARCALDRTSAVEMAGARWRVLACEDEQPAPAPRPQSAPALDVGALRAEALHLRAESERAGLRMAKPRGGRASEWARDDGDEAHTLARRREERASRAAYPGAEIARRVGIAVHSALERLDLRASDPRVALARARDESLRALPEDASPGHTAAAREAAGALLLRFEQGALFARLWASRDHVVARELPVLLPPARDDDAQDFVAGSIDLVLRDAATGELVVVDYKTDRDGADALAPDRREAYRRQGAVYRRALAESLGQGAPPRFELWWLATDRAEVIA
jgi:ATP-dependent helicase/nuclease subunit A